MNLIMVVLQDDVLCSGFEAFLSPFDNEIKCYPLCRNVTLVKTKMKPLAMGKIVGVKDYCGLSLEDVTQWFEEND